MRACACILAEPPDAAQATLDVESLLRRLFNTATVQSKISYIDGDKGILRYRGYPIEQLAEKSSFLEARMSRRVPCLRLAHGVKLVRCARHSNPALCSLSRLISEPRVVVCATI